MRLPSILQNLLVLLLPLALALAVCRMTASEWWRDMVRELDYHLPSKQ